MPTANRILVLSSFFGFMAVGLFGPIYAIFVKNIGGDILEAGLAFGVFSIVSGIFVFSVGRSRFFKEHLRAAVLAGYIIFTIGNAGYLVVSNTLHLFLVQIILGIAGGILEPSWDGLFSASLSEKSATEFWANWAGVRDVATGIGAIAGGAIVAAYSFHALFLIILALNIIATINVFRLPQKRLN